MQNTDIRTSLRAAPHYYIIVVVSKPWCPRRLPPPGTLTECYDELGNRYQLPVYCLAPPVNLISERSDEDPSDSPEPPVAPKKEFQLKVPLHWVNLTMCVLLISFNCSFFLPNVFPPLQLTTFLKRSYLTAECLE